MAPNEGFMPYFGQGIPLATHTPPIDSRAIMEGITNLAMQLKKEQDDAKAMEDPTLQAILGGLMPSGAGGVLPNPTPPHPALVDQTMSSVRSMVDGLHGMPNLARSAPFNPSTMMQRVSPGLDAGVGPIRMEGVDGIKIISRNGVPQVSGPESAGQAIPYGPPDYRDQIQRQARPVQTASPSGSRKMTPEAFTKLTQILQPYSQIESTRIAASGREDTQRLKDASSLERTQIRTALGVLESMRKRDADWLIYDAKLKKIAAAGKASNQDRKDLMKAAALAQQDAVSAANLLGSETVAGLAASEPGSVAREQYEQIIKATQAKAQRAEIYQRMVDALTQASKVQGSGKPGLGKIPDMSTLSEDELHKLAGG